MENYQQAEKQWINPKKICEIFGDGRCCDGELIVDLKTLLLRTTGKTGSTFFFSIE